MKTLVPVVIAALMLTLAVASTAQGVGCPFSGCNSMAHRSMASGKTVSNTRELGTRGEHAGHAHTRR